MEVRKEFMPGIVQNYNKFKQVTASGEPSKGLASDEQAWAVEPFLLDSPKVQQQLFTYLKLLPAKDLEKEGMPSNADQDQQQSWILQKAAANFTSFVASTTQLALSICPDIVVGHLQPEAADVIVEQYVKQLGHPCSNGLTAQ
ncbi:TPA: hypothetical protein ACH3X1_013673 [Trebouxia sp. C0004]